MRFIFRITENTRITLYLFIYHLVRVTYFSKNCTILLIGSFNVEKPTAIILRDENSLSQISMNRRAKFQIAKTVIPFQQSPNNPFFLSKSEAERIEVPKPDPSLSKILPSTTISSSPSSSIRSDRQRKNEGQSSVDTIQTPVTVPAPYVLPVLPYRLLHSALHHTQDSLGQYDYSYTGDSSAKTESRSLDGTTRGAYSYIDPNGLLQQVHYVADHNGFRVMATNLPQAK